MDSTRFDSWTKLFAQRMSRRTAAAGLGAMAVAALGGPTWAVAQADDEDRVDDVDQHKDNSIGDQPDTGDQDAVGAAVCPPVTRCKLNNGICTDMGPIPGGPYEQVWVWTPIPGCAINAPDRLYQVCNDEYPKCQPLGCLPGIDGWAVGCH